MQRPVGFADIVEKVKPSVISVRVKVENPRTSLNTEDLPFPPGSPMERFFRQFRDQMPDSRARRAAGSSAWARAPASSSPPTAMR